MFELPEYADPYALCDRGGVFSGQIPVSALSRLVPLLDNPQGVVAYTLTFNKDSDGRCYIDNSMQSVLGLRCQRCLSGFDYLVDINTRVSPVTGIQQAELLPDQYEPIWLADSRIRLVDLIEDELILAVPDVPKHANTDCSAELLELNHCATQASAQNNGQAAQQNPFAALAELKRKAR